MKINLKSLLIICCSIFITFTVANDANASESKVRIGGKDRYQTAIQISKAGWVDKSKSVVLATGQDFPDALCAAPLAKKLGAPILLNEKNELLPEVEQELKRLKVEEIIIVGGPGVISDDVLNTLKAMNIKCTRIYGANRYETSIKVAQQLDKSTEVAVATGENFPDAISISSIAAQKGMPILLTGKNNLPSGVALYLKNNDIETTYVIGGNDVVSDGVASNFPNVERLQGHDRYATNVAVLNKFSQELDFNSIYATTGNNYPDALAASALACQSKSPVCLVSNGSIDKLKGSIASKLQDTTEVKAIGQTDVVSEDIVEELLQKYGNTNGNLKGGDYRYRGCGLVATQGAWDYYYLDGIYKIKKDGSESIRLDKDSNSIIRGNSARITKSNINIIGEWIYYESVANWMDVAAEYEVVITEGIYKLKTDGTGKTKICSDDAREMMVMGDWIYYCNYSDSGKLYKIKVDGSSRTKIVDDACNRINISGNYIYYFKNKETSWTNFTTNLYRIKIDRTENMKIPSDEKIRFLVVEGDFIYYSTYIDEKDTGKGMSIFKMRTDGTEKIKLCDTPRAYTFNVLNGNLYYFGEYIRNSTGTVVDLYKITKDGVIQSARFKGTINNSWLLRNQIYLYTQDSHSNVYRINMDGTNKLLLNRQ
ncbi:cell wall-binding repeat-containing protein [Clostridium bowmanii]|uniref:cell wall-binding repeat-containing protein n=1 Tax=Clostridium bowmanii TaxID=132925 RepID=UPI001C0B3456|nr:cell wall-binding repeat-containing protein [Clostridium bowmanii]MBU3191368.1 cell wall-binding repeat-containing protein [Clostridium bowmanii]MCA1075787.1 cell wall-binding repeat-containing protein [Clostridium bowmanii]